MPRWSWQASLSQALERLTKADRPPRLAVVGIGHELRGDDAAGIAVARTLRPRVAGLEQVLVIDAGPAPENYAGPLRLFDPDLVLLVDAAQMDEQPGTICWLTCQDTAGLSASTHTLPLYVVAGYLTAELGCEVALLGIQPGNTCLIGAPLSTAVGKAVSAVVQALVEALNPQGIDLQEMGGSMGFRIISKEAMTGFVHSLRDAYRVVGPKLVHDHYVFGEIDSPEDLHLDYTQTVLPPKKYLLPQCEALARFDLNLNGGGVEPIFDEQATVIFGVHTCDLHAIHLLDEVFNTGHADQHYRRRRENTLLVSVECLKPCSEHSFCKSMGTLTAPEVFDLHLTDLGDSHAVECHSERGEALLEKHANTRPATEADTKRLNGVLAEKWPCFAYRLDFDVSELPSLMRMSYGSPLWEELGQQCLTCGSCTNVCPTCTCFNVRDDIDFALAKGERVRLWDSCLLEEFAVVAGGHNFRPSRAARLRHRFLRKGHYQTDEHGLLGCVGCGRCAQACLAHITPVNVFNALYQEHAGETPIPERERV